MDKGLRIVTLFIAGALLLTAGSLSPVFAAQTQTLELTIGTPGKTGCLVCHSDPSLVKIEDGKKKSLYVNPEDFKKTHSDISCIECHTDFTYKSIKPTEQNWRLVAGLACKNCHNEEKNIDHRKDYEAYRESIHGKQLLLEQNPDAPTCADCHGFHDIARLGDPQEMIEFRQNAYRVCGDCHKEAWESYNDWFHGKAYKHSAPDAPPCWDCHVAHKILPPDNPQSPTNVSRVAEQCAKCHKGADISFADYAKYIHGRNTLIEKNIVMDILFKALDYAKKGYNTVKSFFSITG